MAQQDYAAEIEKYKKKLIEMHHKAPPEQRPSSLQSPHPSPLPVPQQIPAPILSEPVPESKPISQPAIKSSPEPETESVPDETEDAGQTPDENMPEEPVQSPGMPAAPSVSPKPGNPVHTIYQQYQADDAFQKFLNENPKIGFIKVQVVTGRGSVPLDSARVTIKKDIEQRPYILAQVATDQDGATLPIPLPAPDQKYSESPGYSNPYATYDITVEYPKFDSSSFLNVPVFDSIISIQTVLMTPALTGEKNGSEVFVEREPSDL